MTKRRLPQRLALLPLAALLCALLVACGGGPGDTSDNACPGWLRDEDNAPAPDPTPGPAGGLERAVMGAYSIARAYYITPYDWRTGLREAWLSAERTMSGGTNVPEVSLNTRTDQELFEAYRSDLAKIDRAIKGQPGEQQIIEAALVAFARSFKDGHTYFLSKSRWEAHQNGSVYSYGLYTTRDGDKIVVTDVVPGSVAMEAGVKPGDVILSSEVLDEEQARTSTDRAFTLRIQKRSGGEQVLELKLAAQALPWLRYEMLPGDIGYVHLYVYPSFRTCTSLVKIRAALDDALNDLNKQGAKAWIIDMRDNGGGSSESAAFVATRLGFDGLLLRTRDKAGRRNDVEVLSDSAIGKAPLVVMVNGLSASSSEVVAYALQDSRRAYVVGSQSRGAVIATYPFPIAGGAFFVTGAFVDVGPSSKVLDKTGVTPDKKVELDLDLLRREGRDSQLEAATTYLKQKLGR